MKSTRLLWHRWVVLCVVPVVAIACQSKTEQKPPETTPQKSMAEQAPAEQKTQLTDEQLLLLFDVLPLGVSYEQAQRTFPNITQLSYERGMEALARRGLYEARAQLTILGHDGSVEFKFRHDSLYSYYFFIKDFEPDSCSIMYRRLQEFYSARLGAYTEEKYEEPNFIGYTSYWPGVNFDFALSNNAYLGRNNILGWGMQESGTLRPKQIAP